MRRVRRRLPPLLAAAALGAMAASPPAFARLIHLYATLAPVAGVAPGSHGGPQMGGPRNGGQPGGVRQIALTLRPAAAESPGGLFVATFNTLSHRLRYKLRYHRLAGRILAATIDGPTGQADARTLVRLRLRQDGRIEGAAHLGGRAEALVRKGRAEVVVTTAAHRGGAIAGRIETGRPPRR